MPENDALTTGFAEPQFCDALSDVLSTKDLNPPFQTMEDAA